MVLKRIFKSKEQRKKDKLKTDLKKKISNVGGGRSNQGTAKRLQRELKALDGPKKEVKKTVGGRISRSSQNMSGKNADGTRTGSTPKKDDKKKVVKKATMTAKERAQAMAKKRIASGKTIAQVKADNEAKMKARAKKKYADFKAKRNKK
tara:strand:+ start:322 stop:768 length:447 start_codon:yes stop_codon:yes gene_type:complete